MSEIEIFRQLTSSVEIVRYKIQASARLICDASIGGAMKHRLLAFVLLFSGSGWAGPPAKKAAYNIDVHVSASRAVKYSESAPRYQHLDVTIHGKKYELESVLGVRELLSLGDYKARLVTDEHGRGEYDSRQVYEFQFSDKTTREFLVVGQLE
jgi:hypothetical protein